MKTLLTIIITLFLSFSSTIAQNSTSYNTTQQRELSKEEKKAIKEQKEADLKKAFRKARLTAADQQLVRTSMKDRSAYKKTLKADPSLSEDRVATKYKEFSKAEDQKLKDHIGKDKYKKFKDIQRAQKASAEEDSK
jgi:hypothetical protein